MQAIGTCTTCSNAKKCEFVFATREDSSSQRFCVGEHLGQLYLAH